MTTPTTTSPSAVVALGRRTVTAWRRATGRLPWGAQLAVVLGAATFVARLPGLVYTGLFDRDEAYLTVMGKVLANGGHLYVDVIDRKPPIVPTVYSVARELSVDMRFVRLLCALGILANGVVVALLVRRLVADSPRAGSERGAALAAGLLAVVGTALFLPADAQAANFELWGLAPASGAVLAAVVARRTSRPAWWWFALAGALVAVAVNCKQPYIVVLVPVGLEALRPAARLAKVAAVAAGFVVGTLPMGLMVDLSALWRWTWADNGDYVDGGLSLARALGVGVGLTVVFLCFHLPLIYGFWAAVTRRVRLDRTVVVWAVMSLMVVPIGFRFFGHYYQQVVPPLAVLSGVALASAPRSAWRIIGSATALATGVLVTLSFVLPPDLSNFTDLGRYVQRTTDPEDRILVWGAVPDVYVSADREPSGVFLHDGYLTGNWASRQVPLDPTAVASEPFRSRWLIFLADLAADPPELIIDGARPGTDWAAYPPSAYPLGTLLKRCYKPDTRIDGLPVWRRDWDACPA